MDDSFESEYTGSDGTAASEQETLHSAWRRATHLDSPVRSGSPAPDVHGECDSIALQIRAALSEDARCRVPGVTDGLYGLSAIGHRGPLPHAMPTLRAEARFFEEDGIDSIAENDAEFERRLSRTSERVFDGFDLARHGFVLAGGAVSALVLTNDHDREWTPKPHDYDLFLYGHTETSALGAINALSRHLQGSSRSDYDFYIFRTASCITFKVNGDILIQIILRLYGTKAEVIHGFDMGSCAALWDGAQVLFTKLGVLAFKYRANILNIPARRGHSYETRLSRYFKRGFSIVLPDLAPTDINLEGHRITLPYLTAVFNDLSDCLCGLAPYAVHPTVEHEETTNIHGFRILEDENHEFKYEFSTGYPYEDLGKLTISNIICLEQGSPHLCAYKVLERLYADSARRDICNIAFDEITDLYTGTILFDELRYAVRQKTNLMNGIGKIFSILGETLGMEFMNIGCTRGVEAMAESIDRFVDRRIQELNRVPLSSIPFGFMRSTDATALVSSDMPVAEWYGHQH